MSGKPALGLFFTDDHIEISQLNSDGSKSSRFSELSLAPGVIVNGEIKDSLALTKAIGQLLTNIKSNRSAGDEEVVVGVSDNRIFLREFSLPKYASAEKGIEDAIEWQIQSLLPVLPPNVVTDWQIIGRDQFDQVEVLVVAIPKDIIDSYLTAVTNSGLRVVAIEPAVFANLRIITPNLLQNKNQLLVYTGNDYSEFTYVTNGKPRFSDFLTQIEIQKKGSIINAIRDYVVFSNSKHPTRQIQEILVSGYDAQAQVVATNLAALRVASLLAVSRLQATKDIDHHLLRTSHGLSLKTTEASMSPNLLPPDFRLDVIRHRLIKKWKRVINSLIFFTLLICFGFFFLLRDLQAQEALLSSLKTQHEQEILLPENQTLIGSADQLNSTTQQLLLLRETTGNENGILREVSFATPDGIVLTSFVYARGPGSKRLADPNSSWAITGTANSRDVVLDFFSNLTSQPDFENGRLFFGSLEKDTEVNFRIASQIK